MNEEMYMKKTMFAACLLLTLAIFGMAQKQKKSPDPTDAPDKQSAARSTSGKTKNSGKQQADSGFLNAGAVLQAQLQSTLDVQRSHVGDQVILKTTQAIKQNGETIIPKGTQLVGRVTEVQQRTKENAMSKLGLVFDQLQGRDLTTPITASILSVTNASAAANVADDMFSSDVSGSSSSSGRVSGGSGGGGGLLGGVTNTVGGVTNAAGGVVNTATQTVGSTTNAALGSVNGAGGTLTRTINGIQISNSASGSAQSSTTLSSPNKNLKIEKGATFQLQVSN